MGKVEKTSWKQTSRRVVGAAAFCAVFISGAFDDGALRGVQDVKMKKTRGTKEEERTETSGWNSDWLWGNRGKLTIKAAKKGEISATPAAETRLSVRDLRPGDLLAARWEDEERNGTPGFWNHLAIVAADGACVVEAQKSADGVVTAPINDFLARYSDVCVVRFFDSETARRAAVWAENRVAVEGRSTPPLAPREERDARAGKTENKLGNVEFDGCAGWGDGGEKESGERGKTRLSGPRYSWSASLTLVLREDATTENCVSLVRRAYWKAAGVDYRWRTPDDLARWDKSGDFAEIGRF